MSKADSKIIRLGCRYLPNAQAEAMLKSNRLSAEEWLLKHHPPYKDATREDRKALFDSLYTLTTLDLQWVAGRQDGRSIYSGDQFSKFEHLAIGRKNPTQPIWSRNTICLGEHAAHFRRGSLTLDEWFGWTRRNDRIAGETGQKRQRYRVVRTVLDRKAPRRPSKALRKLSLDQGGPIVR